MKYLIAMLWMLPFATYAAPAPTDFNSLVKTLVDLIELVIYVLFGLTFLVLMWGLIKGWIIGGGDAKSVESGKKVLLSGIIALVVMTAVWGLVHILKSSLFGA